MGGTFKVPPTAKVNDWLAEVLVEPFPTHFSCLAVAFVDLESRVDGRSMLTGEGADAEEVEVHVDAVGDRLLVVVFHDKVLIEEAKVCLDGVAVSPMGALWVLD